MHKTITVFYISLALKSLNAMNTQNYLWYWNCNLIATPLEDQGIKSITQIISSVKAITLIIWHICWAPVDKLTAGSIASEDDSLLEVTTVSKYKLLPNPLHGKEHCSKAYISSGLTTNHIILTGCSVALDQIPGGNLLAARRWKWYFMCVSQLVVAWSHNVNICSKG